MDAYTALLWIVSASVLGFAVTAFFSGILHLPRNLFLLFYIPPVGALVVAFFRVNRIDLRELLQHNWIPGLVGAGLVTLLVVKNVLSQPSTPRRKGFALLGDVLWPGLVYGLVDALLLSVLPAMAVVLAFSGGDGAATMAMGTQVVQGVLALLASLVVAAIYHLGFQEFRGAAVVGAMIGNGVMSLGFILTMNPLAAILPHMIMHVTAILHGRESTYQLPPHDGPIQENAPTDGDSDLRPGFSRADVRGSDPVELDLPGPGSDPGRAGT